MTQFYCLLSDFKSSTLHLAQVSTCINVKLDDTLHIYLTKVIY